MCLQKSMASGRWRTNRRRSHSSTPDWQPPGRGSPVAVRLRGRSAAPAAARKIAMRRWITRILRRRTATRAKHRRILRRPWTGMRAPAATSRVVCKCAAATGLCPSHKPPANGAPARTTFTAIPFMISRSRSASSSFSRAFSVWNCFGHFISAWQSHRSACAKCRSSAR
jgi:hypothetical protein